jgi:superkiller protein 3
MGILTEDENLIDAALSEVLGLPVDQRQELDVHRDVDYLVVQHQLSKVCCVLFPFGLNLNCFQERSGDAMAVAQREVFLEPGKSEPRIRLANLMIQSKRPRAALSLLSEAVSTSIGDDPASAVVALRLHSVALCSPDAPTQNLQEGLREIQRAVMLRPFNLKSWQTLGYIRSCMGQ